MTLNVVLPGESAGAPAVPRRRTLTLAWGVAAAVAVLGLTGCATTYKLDNQVNSFSALAEVPQAGYRFERTPLQQTAPDQARVEALAEAALARAGLRRDEASPRYAVQVWAGTQRAAYPWASPGYGPGWGPRIGGGLGVGVGTGGRVGVGVGIGMPFGGAPYDRPWYRREVGLLMRDLGSGQVVYETHAVNDGPWLEPDRTIGAMFDASLHGFPRPPSGPRVVDVMMPR